MFVILLTTSGMAEQRHKPSSNKRRIERENDEDRFKLYRIFDDEVDFVPKKAVKVLNVPPRQTRSTNLRAKDRVSDNIVVRPKKYLDPSEEVATLFKKLPKGIDRMILDYLKVPNLCALIKTVPALRSLLVSEICRRALRELYVSSHTLKKKPSEICQCPFHVGQPGAWYMQSSSLIDIIGVVRHWGILRCVLHHYCYITNPELTDVCFGLADFSHEEETILRYWWAMHATRFVLKKHLWSAMIRSPLPLNVVPHLAEQLVFCYLHYYVDYPLSTTTADLIREKLAPSNIVARAKVIPDGATRRFWSLSVENDDGSRFELGNVDDVSKLLARLLEGGAVVQASTHGLMKTIPLEQSKE